MIPQQLNNIPRPKGFYTAFKQWPITPLSSNMYWKADDIARFLINIDQGVMDPYRSHIQITVQVNTDIQKVGGLQIDSSAQSFISQTVVSSNQVQLQRITQYDTLAAILTDLGFSQYVCQTRDVQGLGFTNVQSHKPWTNNAHGLQTQVYYQTHYSPTLTNSNAGLIVPTRCPWRTGQGDTVVQDQTDVIIKNPPWQMWGTGGIISPSNPILNYDIAKNTQLVPTCDQIQQGYGRFQNLRFQYVDKIHRRDYPDTVTSKVMTAPMVQGQTWDINTITTRGYDPYRPYSITFPQQDTITTDINLGRFPITIKNQCGVQGFQKAICPQFAKGTGQAMISATIPQCQMQNGIILRQKIPITKKTFRLPLLSAICGVLIPPDQFTLIPLRALYNTLLQLTFNRYAMFTTGYSDVHQLDKNGMNIMQQRKWLITAIAWNFHIYTFGDQRVQQYIKAQLTKPLRTTATGYALVSQYQLPNGQQVRNTFPIGCQYQDLCQIYTVFIPNDYQTKSFCRKQFRISNNITSLQIKLDTNFYPTQPIIGNAGNPQAVDSTGDNWPYYQMILLSSNRLFSVNHPSPKINQKNFAINQRCYDVNRQDPFYSQSIMGNKYTDSTGKVYDSSMINMHTAMGMANFHQNRFVGRAVYVYTWQPYGHSNAYLSGINATGLRNFQITFGTSPVNPFPRDQTMMIFARYNQLIQYTQNGINVYGK